MKNLDTIQAKCVTKLQSIYAQVAPYVPTYAAVSFPVSCSCTSFSCLVLYAQSGRVPMRDAIKAIDGEGSRKISAKTFLCCAIAPRVLLNYDNDD